MQDRVEAEHLNFDKERETFLKASERLNSLISKLLKEYDEEECKKKIEKLQIKQISISEPKGTCSIFQHKYNCIR